MRLKLSLACVVAAAFLVWGYLTSDSPVKAARQWSDALWVSNTSAVLERTCLSMQGQVNLRRQSSFSAQVDIAIRAIVIPGAKAVPQRVDLSETERSGAHARVVAQTSYSIERPVGANAVQLTHGGAVSEYWNMTREGWGFKRWKWCGYGGLVR